jgi:hypothetical protein
MEIIRNDKQNNEYWCGPCKMLHSFGTTHTPRSFHDLEQFLLMCARKGIVTNTGASALLADVQRFVE